MSNLNAEGRFFRNPMWPYKEYKRIIYEPGRVARVKLNRPRYLNAMSHALWGELEDALDRASEDPECRVIVVSGEGRCFACGDDVIGLSPEGAPTLVTDETPEQIMERYGSETAVWHAYNIEHDYYPLGYATRLRTIPKPTIAMVHGYCIFAGCILATNLDLIFASEDALFLGGANMWDVGRRKALEIAYEHRFMTAREAQEFHLVSRVYPNREILEKETLAYADRVANQVPGALRRLKQAHLHALDIQGYGTAHQDGASQDTWRMWAADGHPERYQGRGIARTPVALANLKAKFEGEGKEVPEQIREALARAAVRDDKGAWQRALHQPWREKGRLARADASKKAEEEKEKAEAARLKKS